MAKRFVIILLSLVSLQLVLYFNTTATSDESINRQYENIEVDIEVLMLDRLSHIDGVCKNINTSEGIGTFSPKNHFRRDQNTGTIYCFLHKVGSTAWHSVFRKLDQYYRKNSGEKFQVSFLKDK